MLPIVLWQRSSKQSWAGPSWNFKLVARKISLIASILGFSPLTLRLYIILPHGTNWHRHNTPQKSSIFTYPHYKREKSRRKLQGSPTTCSCFAKILLILILYCKLLSVRTRNAKTLDPNNSIVEILLSTNKWRHYQAVAQYATSASPPWASLQNTTHYSLNTFLLIKKFCSKVSLRTPASLHAAKLCDVKWRMVV